MVASSAALASAPEGNLSARWREFKAQNPKVRIRDAASALGVSEAELVALGDRVAPLRPEWREFLMALPTLGNVMALTRNESCVHERHGPYKDVSLMGHVALVLGEDIDLRIFLSRWRYGFAVREESSIGERRSLQVFDGSGTAVHKVYATEHTDMAAFDALVQRFTAPWTTPPVMTAAAPSKPALPDSDIDVAGMRDAWSKLEDTHDFNTLLMNFKVKRTQALKLGGADFTRQVKPSAARRALELAAATQTPIMVFVGNPGCIQIHTGEVTNLKPTGPWFNVLDPKFNLHLREDQIDQAWIVRKPTRDGDVTSIELFDAAGETIAQLFGKRKPGLPELNDWRGVVDAVRTSEAL